MSRLKACPMPVRSGQLLHFGSSDPIPEGEGRYLRCLHCVTVHRFVLLPRFFPVCGSGPSSTLAVGWISDGDGRCLGVLSSLDTVVEARSTWRSPAVGLRSPPQIRFSIAPWWPTNFEVVRNATFGRNVVPRVGRLRAGRGLLDPDFRNFDCFSIE